jgi:hypothetical protein
VCPPFNCVVLLLLLLTQLLAQVSYLKAINASYQPTHVLQPTTSKVWCHGGAHKSIRDVLDGCAAGVSRHCWQQSVSIHCSNSCVNVQLWTVASA